MICFGVGAHAIVYVSSWWGAAGDDAEDTSTAIVVAGALMR
jgi:hypothetical protein